MKTLQQAAEKYPGRFWFIVVDCDKENHLRFGWRRQRFIFLIRVPLPSSLFLNPFESHWARDDVRVITPHRMKLYFGLTDEMIPTIRLIDIANFGPKYKFTDSTINIATLSQFLDAFSDGSLQASCIGMHARLIHCRSTRSHRWLRQDGRRRM